MVLLVVVWIAFLHSCYGSLLLCQKSECTSYNLSKNERIEISEGRVRHISAVYQKCNCIGNLTFTSKKKDGIIVYLDINCKNYTHFIKHNSLRIETGFFGEYTSNQNFETSIIRSKSSLVFVDLSSKKRKVIKQNITDKALQFMDTYNLTFNTAQNVTLGSETCFSNVVISSCTCESPTVARLAAINATHVQCIGSGLYSLRFKWLINGQEIQTMSIIRSESYDNYTATSVLEVPPNSSNNTTVTCIVTSQSKNQSRSLVLYEERNSSRTKVKKSTKLVIIIICSSVAVIVVILLVVLLLISRRRQHHTLGSPPPMQPQVRFTIPSEPLGCYKDVIIENPASYVDEDSSSTESNIQMLQGQQSPGSEVVYAVPYKPEPASEYQRLDFNTMRSGRISSKQEMRRKKEFKSKTMMRHMDSNNNRNLPEVYSTNIIINRHHSI